MKITLLPLALIATVAAAFAVEPIPAEEAQRVAHQLHDAVGNDSDAPFVSEVDPDRPCGFKADGHAGVMVLPDRKLTTDALNQVGKDPLAVGQLWMLEISLASGGRAIANDKVRLVRIGDGDKARDVQLYYLGAAKNDAGELELVIFAKGKAAPFLRVPLKKVTGTSYSSPLEIDGRKESEDSGVLTIRILGEYAAELPAMKPE